ncbi:disease resistance protein L6-like isoform X1 [Syzygium oleosum]|uniref:disease resistance protein L6-like isoform X1 n=1 Tax=Syzygium oleosum TaxID=219896 RepID=UPI0024BA4B45|nr:disease resistance protein L6-like isoform X1 [Syzygium oleosum]
MAPKLVPSLATTALAAVLFHFFLKRRRSREINGREANDNAAANDGTAGGASSTHTSTGVPEVPTPSGANKDAAASNGTTGGDSGTRTSTGVPEMDTSSGPAMDAAASHGTAGGNSGTHTSSAVREMASSSGANTDATANDGTARGHSGTRTSTVVPEMDTSSGPAMDAAASHGTAGGNSGTHTSSEVREMASSSEANMDAAANDGTARGHSGTRPSTVVPEMATSSGPAMDAAANDGTAGCASSAHTSTGVAEVATPSGANKDAATNDGTTRGDPGTRTSTGVPEMATSSGPAMDAPASHGTAGGDSGTHTSSGVREMASSSGANRDAAANDGIASGDPDSHTSTGVPEMDTPSKIDHEVFLSFRGLDTRDNFTDHLYQELLQAKVHTFKDDECLRKGEEFALNLLQAIEQSKILIPIFSKNYASSPWCLKEVAKMVEGKKNRGQKIIPIFYHVEPADVRHQRGDYKEAFLEHEKKQRFDQKTIGGWRDALKAVADINGHSLQNVVNRREGEFVKKFTREICKELENASLEVSDYFVPVDNRVDEIMKNIDVGTSETRIIGIYGMSGIGKTTVAKIIFNKLLCDFEKCCFLGNIQETSKNNGIQCLQKQLISDIVKTEYDIRDDKKGAQMIRQKLSQERVLLLLDDVEQTDHINALALASDRDWLGRGSKIIITTRMEGVLNFSEVDWRYDLPYMDGDQSLQLFSKHAFRRDSPLNKDIKFSERAIEIAGGLPLALEVVGGLLFGIDKKEWDGTLKMLESVPNDELMGKLKISYDRLSPKQKDIFLDIACFFSGYDTDILVHFWNEHEYPTEVNLKVLRNMCLIKINEDNEVWMHDQLRNLGRKMVLDKSEEKIEKQTRAWDPKQGLDLLTKYKGPKEAEVLRLNLQHQPRYPITYEGFENLSNLRFLEVKGSKNNFRAKEALKIDPSGLRNRFDGGGQEHLTYEGSTGQSNQMFLADERLLWLELSSNVLQTHDFLENSSLLTKLRWLSWHNIPTNFNITHFSMEDVVILDLSYSEITHD